MKKLFAILSVVAMALVFVPAANAQLTKEQRKERQELRKANKKELNEKATKDARKEAKKLSKEGWVVSPGALPLEKQLDRSYLMQMEYDEEGFPAYIMAEAMSIGQNYDAAKMQAMELAKLQLAGQIQTEVVALVENRVANEQLSAEQAASITRSVQEGKNFIAQSIGRIVPVTEVYRTLKNKNKEVLVKVAYNQEMAKQAAKKAIVQSLEEQGDELKDQLNDILGLKK